jgi:hypothetical protein
LFRRRDSLADQPGAICEKSVFLAICQEIVGPLIIGKRHRWIKNMNCAGHVRMNQTHDFKVASSWELDTIGLAADQFAGGYARGAIEVGIISCRSRAATTVHTGARRSDLLRASVLFQKGHRMDLFGRESPSDFVTGVNP